ncbi:PSD1 and planctomycete cytochrome C domain-containing protein [Stieleria marina]|uniref:Planctomycete cytochrome C n=1 Tax=Stieleria marina TaxID=1930275 RepID=A0A517NY35_9BACT|nr:Planctomycete cytochrome C [Planctomycetes bacterium K23_9]
MLRTHLIVLITMFAPTFVAGGEIDFSREVLPILSDKCFVCHGPDSEEGLLRLDSYEAATEDLGGYHAIDPAAVDKSNLIERINHADDPMPPEDAEKQLTADERNTLQKWVQQGGKYARHWAFVAPQAAPDHNGDSPEQIDTFIRRQLLAKNIDFAPVADNATLARRAALVLTGLPPDPDQLDAFLADDSADAYETLVDQLLQDSRFGEHQARYWLDAVRYGDTHGLHLDNRRGIYPYRDWVVRAFNNNLPLNDFITWQLAGDLMPKPTLEQQIATGFVRLNPSTGEGGAIANEFQAKNNFDRVENFGTVFLGLSLTCARCHTHKYDPIQHDEYYQLMAFFNSTAEPALDGNSYTYGPTVRVPANQQDWQLWQQHTVASQQLLSGFDKQRVVSTGTESSRDAQLLQYAQSTAKWKSSDWQYTTPLPSAAEIPPAQVNDPSKSKWTKGAGLPGSISGRAAKKKLPSKGQAVWVRFDLNAPKEQSFWLTFSGERGSQVFVDDQTDAVAAKANDSRVQTSRMQVSAGKHRIQIKILGGPSVTELTAQIHNPWDALASSKDWSKASSSDQLLMVSDPLGPAAVWASDASANQIATSIQAIQDSFTTTLIAQELPQARETFVLHRGEYDQPQGDPLPRDVLKVTNAFPADAPRNRLGLAQWLTSAEHPLVARVLVNRIWQRVFGEAIVRSPEDFGVQGQQPTHPELLDWLAVELQRSQWDLKHLLRLMVTSRAFRQHSAHRTDVDDPENKLIARGPRFRLDAEVLRDMGLWASGLLDPRMGGEGVKPYQPSGMWKALAHPASNTKSYVRDAGDKLYRRSLYVYWKRTSPHPMMTLFDAPDRESSCVRRSRTSTALQSLGMLNETQRVEMARKLAERLIVENDNDAERLQLLFKLIASRSPNATERTACVDLLNQMKKRYSQNEQDAKKLLSIGDAETNDELDPITLAAWTQVAVTVLASDLAILVY